LIYKDLIEKILMKIWPQYCQFQVRQTIKRGLSPFEITNKTVVRHFYHAPILAFPQAENPDNISTAAARSTVCQAFAGKPFPSNTEVQ